MTAPAPIGSRMGVSGLPHQAQRSVGVGRVALRNSTRTMSRRRAGPQLAAGCACAGRRSSCPRIYDASGERPHTGQRGLPETARSSLPEPERLARQSLLPVPPKRPAPLMDASNIIPRRHHKKGGTLASRFATPNATARGSAAEVIDNPGPDRPVAPVAGQRFRQLWQFLTRAFSIF